MIGRSGEHVAERLRECSLYHDDLDLAVYAPNGEMAGYGLFWADPITGVGLQVSLAALNKSVMWVCYFGGVNPGYQSTIRYKIACKLAEHYVIDLLCDLAAIGLFTVATYRCFSALVV